MHSIRFGFVGLRRRLELKVWGNRLTRCVAPTYHRYCERRLRCCFPKLWETLVVECHRRASSSITIAPIKQDTSLIHVQDSTQRTILEHELAICIMVGKSKFDQKKLPAVESKIQVLKRRPANTVVLSAFNLSALIVSSAVSRSRRVRSVLASVEEILSVLTSV